MGKPHCRSSSAAGAGQHASVAPSSAVTSATESVLEENRARNLDDVVVQIGNRHLGAGMVAMTWIESGQLPHAAHRVPQGTMVW